MCGAVARMRSQSRKGDRGVGDLRSSHRAFDLMKFRLTYEGELKAAGNHSRRVNEKWSIRKALAPQLEELWKVHPALKGIGLCVERPLRMDPQGERRVAFKPRSEVAWEIKVPIIRGDRRFVPLVRNSLNLVCGLDILFMRKDQPGELILKGGDIDNRLKTLFDALSVPDAQDIRPGDIPRDPQAHHSVQPPHDAPLFLCLLESDSLITAVNVTTDRLLTAPNASPSTVHLVIEVSVAATEITELNIGFIGD